MAPSQPRKRKQSTTRKRTGYIRFNPFNVFRGHEIQRRVAAQKEMGQGTSRNQGEWSAILGREWRRTSREVKDQYAAKADQLNRVDDALWLKARKEKAMERARMRMHHRLYSQSRGPNCSSHLPLLPKHSRPNTLGLFLPKTEAYSLPSLAGSCISSAQTTPGPSTPVSDSDVLSLPAGANDALDASYSSDDDTDLEYPRVDVCGLVNGARIQVLAKLGFYDNLPPPPPPEPADTPTSEEAADVRQHTSDCFPSPAGRVQSTAEAGPSRIAGSGPRDVQAQSGTATTQALQQGTFTNSGGAPSGLLSPFDFTSLRPVQASSSPAGVASYGPAHSLVRPATRAMNSINQTQTGFRGTSFLPGTVAALRAQMDVTQAMVPGYNAPYAGPFFMPVQQAQAVVQFPGFALPGYNVGSSTHGPVALASARSASAGDKVSARSVCGTQPAGPSSSTRAGVDFARQGAQEASQGPDTSSSSGESRRRGPTFMELLYGDLDLFPDPSEYANPSTLQSAMDPRFRQVPNAASALDPLYQNGQGSSTPPPPPMQLAPPNHGENASTSLGSVHTSNAAPRGELPLGDYDIIDSFMKHDFTSCFAIPPQ